MLLFYLKKIRQKGILYMFVKILNLTKENFCKEKIITACNTALPTLKSGAFLLGWMLFLVLLEFLTMFFAKAKPF